MQTVQAAVQATPAAVTLLQFYPVLAAIGGLLFWAGILTRRVTEQSARITNLENESKNDIAVAVEIGRIDQRLKALEKSTEHISRDLSGIQRSLANIATGKVGSITKFEQDDG
jgi:hypothetical protein